MNVYCYLCGSEMEIMQDLGTELRVFPCGCSGKETEKEISDTDEGVTISQIPDEKDTPYGLSFRETEF